MTINLILLNIWIITNKNRLNFNVLLFRKILKIMMTVSDPGINPGWHDSE
jgi:hypothetical protein